MPFSSKPSTIAIKKPLLLCDLGGGRLAPPSKCPLFFLGTCPQDYNPQIVLLWNVDILGLSFQCFVMEKLEPLIMLILFLQMRGNNTMHNIYELHCIKHHMQ